jgi:hypothetical protein
MATRRETAREPWERQVGESRQGFDAFRRYRDMGPTRSYTRVAQELNRSRTLIGRWGQRWRWPGRADAWDREQDRLRREKHRDAVEEMAVRQARQAMAAANVLMQPALDVVRRIRDDPDALSKLPLADLFALAVTAVRHLPPVFEAERTARGIPATLRLEGKVEHEHSGKVEHDHTFAERVMEDPDFARDATALFGRLARRDRQERGGPDLN